MPLVRFEVRNELRLGLGELYREANREEDPKAVLDAVAAAALVGILRQLGDLAEFAAEVFHGLQEQVMSTVSRSNKLMVRVLNIEAALPPLEKVVLSQTSHIHFAYTAGSEWHPCIQNEKNHFIYNDLPQFIMDSYAECRDPPRLHLLDRFDTGGPGSCLKRYSDPTFFRRASSNATEPDAVKVPKYKRARKTKRNRDSAHHASMSNHSGRMQFTTPTINGQTSPSHTASTIDMTLKYDAGDPSNSLDSRTGSGYIECVFQLNSSVRAEEDELKEFSSIFMKHNDVTGSVFPEGQPDIADNNFHHSSSPEQIAALSSSCVTWDEKAEIVAPRGQHCDDVSEMLAAESDLDTQDGLAANLKNPKPLNIELNDADTPKSSSSSSQINEVESELDDFMDALNTIESESENDSDCQTKHEVEQFSSKVDIEVEEITHEVTVHIPDHHPSEYESRTLSASSNENIPCESPNSFSSYSFAHAEEYHISGKSSKLDSSPGIKFSTSADAIDNSKVEFVSDPSSSVSATSILNVQELFSNKAIRSSNRSQESQADFSSVHSTTFWTNGGLLGLAPSKPPDFAVSNATRPDYVTRSEGEAGLPPNHTYMSSNDGGGAPERLIKDAGNMERVPSSKGTTSWQEDQATKENKPADFHLGNRCSHSYEDGENITSAVTPGNESQHDSDSKVTPIESSQESDKNSSQRLGFGHRLLVNGFSRKMSLVHDGEHEPTRLLKTTTLERQSWQNEVTHQATPEKAYNEQFGSKYSIDSLMSSPPLEHMKISFHHIDGFEDSKLKLKFPDGNRSNESIRDMFPSFQLIPESAIPLRHVGSESDDDTFCRSSPYTSDDCLSHDSVSDSEQWEPDEFPEDKDHELYDASCRIFPDESFSSSPQPGKSGNNGICIDKGLPSMYTENGAYPHLSASLDLPCFDAMNPVVNGKTKDNLVETNQLELEYLNDSTPSPPPLPPVKWRVSKPHSDLSEGKQHALFETHEHAFDIKPLESTVPQQPKPAPVAEQKMKDDTLAFKPKSKQQDQQKLNCQKEANQSASGKDIDEKEDFLHQIRTKSFTLRRTATAKPTISSGPTASNKVSAILEKANAIRQAVASDDGEDDDWSDT